MVVRSLFSLQFHIFDAVNAMLFNEVFKEHYKVEQQLKDLKAAIARDQKQIEAFTARLRAVKAQVETSRFTSQTALNNR